MKLTGVAPLVLHNIRLADPMDEFAQRLKEVSGKRKKTESDYLEMSRIEFFGGLYTNEDGRVIIPGVSLEAMIQDGAKVSKRGKDAKAGVIVEEDPLLIYDGPKDPESLYADKRFVLRAPVRVGPARIIRTRPQFPVWSLQFKVAYLIDVLSKKDLTDALVAAGRLKGLGTWRPRFGRFEVAA